MVFGAVPGQPPQRPTFGTKASNSAMDAPTDETILETPGQSSRTQIFGTAASSEPAAPANKNQTMMFGRNPGIPKVTAGSVELAGMSADENAPNESTVRVDSPTDEQEPSGDEPSEPARQDRTQRFAMTDLGGATPPEGRNTVQDRHNRTQLFAMSTSAETTAPVGQQVETLPGDHGVLRERESEVASSAPTLDLSSTLPPDQPLPLLGEPESSEPQGVSLLHDPANAAPREDQPAELDGPVATTLPNLGPVQARLPPLRLELTQEPGGSPADFNRPTAPNAPVLTPTAAAEDAAAMRAARGGGAGRIVVIILALVALALAAVLIYRLFGDQIMAAIKPPEQPVGALMSEVFSRWV